jgi:hypothetical protein
VGRTALSHLIEAFESRKSVMRQFASVDASRRHILSMKVGWQIIILSHEDYLMTAEISNDSSHGHHDDKKVEAFSLAVKSCR